MKTFSAKAEEIDRKWYVIDAENKVLGDVAVAAANLLRGKNKPLFTSHVDCGDFVIIVNAGKVRLTGNKEDQKIYTSYSGYVGGQKRETASKLRERRPELIVERAVRGMIPHNRLGRQIFKKVKIYAGAEHPHDAQKVEAYEI
jgi:large subunit ribosomal protein L13